MTYESDFNPRNRTTDAPVAMDLDASHSVPPPAHPLAGIAAKLKIPQQWVGMSGYLVAGIFLGLVLIAALSIGRSSDASASLPPAAPDAMLDNIVRLHAHDIGTPCWAGLGTQGTARLTVALEVGVDGRIRYAAASGASPVMRDCVESHVKAWEFLPQAQALTMALPVEIDRR
ncbi:MAG: hypothetical protein KIT84_10200 [Labilithrix sp.]|nr:hypothetical protein [Labilithrix sp.]MCW5811375.1 hypothetical protein [Labilithrix sp.]